MSLKIEYNNTARILDISGAELGKESKTFREQRMSLRAPQVQKWLDKTAAKFGDAATRIEMETRVGDGEPTFDWFAMVNGKSSMLLEETNKDPRNVALAQRRDAEMRERDEREMKALLEPFAPDNKWIATGYAWDISHNLVKFTGKRNRETGSFQVQMMRKTHRNYYVEAGKPVWMPGANIITMDPMKRVSEIGVMPSKSMYPYFNRLENALPAEM